MSQSKAVQMQMVCYGQFIAECSYEVADLQRWKKLRFEMTVGQSWRGPKFPTRISGHEKM